jgi:hypothetical protein
MTTRTEPDQVEITRSEKALAVVLAVFILIGGIWAYFKLDEVNQPVSGTERLQRYGGFGSAAERAAIRRDNIAASQARRAERAVVKAREDLELKREAFRTALDAGTSSSALSSEYGEARRDYAAARRDAREADLRVAETSGPARIVERKLLLAQREAARQFNDERRSHDRLVFGLRFALVLLMLGAGYGLLSRMRGRRSRYLPVALAEIGAAAALALVMAVDYTTDYLEVDDLGLLALSLAGAAMTLTAFVALQRYIAKRIPLRRVRRRECPFCGFPVHDNASCEGCGRRVVGECSTCHRPRRVGTEYCGACGAA